MAKIWEFPEPSRPSSSAPDSILDFLLQSRGYSCSEGKENFLAPKLGNLSDPFRIPDMEAAAERVDEALGNNQRILLYSDYDVDGMSSAAIVYRFLKTLGGRVEVFLPERLKEGYGLTEAGLTRALQYKHYDLLIALDCGTTSINEVKALRSGGTDVIIIDHHELSAELPDANALVNPQRGETDHYLATAGLAFKFCHGFLKYKGTPDEFDLKSLLDLVAMGTVADLVPLQEDNRILVSAGLRRMNSETHVGVQALIRVAGVRGTLKPSTIGFVLGPRLNASGRLSEPLAGWRLLTTECETEARHIARQLDTWNKERQSLEQEAYEEASAWLKDHFDPSSEKGIVVASRNWHQGVIGIVASRILRDYYRPTFVISIDENGKGKGSGRSIDGISLMDAIRSCDDYFLNFGGHAMAAGLEIEEGRIDDFRKCFNSYLTRYTDECDYQEKLKIDLELSGQSLNHEVADIISRMEPFGRCNPSPLCAVRKVKVASPVKTFGKNHCKFTAEVDGVTFDTVAFGLADARPKGELDIAGHWGIDDWTHRPCFRIVDWRASES